MPTMVAVPPGASIARTCSAVSLRPSTQRVMHAALVQFAHLLAPHRHYWIDDVGGASLVRAASWPIDVDAMIRRRCDFPHR